MSSNTDVVFQYTGSETIPKNVTIVHFHCSITDIEDRAYGQTSAFDSCNSLKKVVFNEGLQTIGLSAFYRCKSLESITLPSTVTEIRNASFFGCTSLREVVCSGVLPKIGTSTFNECSALERIVFPNLSSRLEAIIRAGQVDIQNKIQQYINQGNIDWERGGTIYIPAAVYTSVSYNVSGRRGIWKELKQRVDQIVQWIKYYEMKEATTLFP